MKLQERYRRWCIVAAACALLAACSVQPSPRAPIAAPPASARLDAGAHGSPMMLPAVITQVDGDVMIVEPTGRNEQEIADSSARPARHLSLLAPGSSVQLDDGSSVGLVCANDHWIEVNGPLDWTLTDRACDDGRNLVPGTYEKLAPSLGRVQTIQDHQVLQPETLESEYEYGYSPVIISPRNSALLAVEPSINWSAVDNAVQYVLSLSGARTYADVTLDADAVVCTDEDESGSVSVCTTPWPTETWGALERSQIYFLTVSVRKGLLEPANTSEPSALRVLNADEASNVESQISRIEALDLGPETTDLLIAAALVERAVRLNDATQGLYSRAIPLFGEVAATAPSPELYVTLGDVYRAVDLQRYALSSYKAALDLLEQTQDDAEVRAAAEYGLGQVAYGHQDFAAAELHFDVAVELYRTLAADEELQASVRALEETRERL